MRKWMMERRAGPPKLLEYRLGSSELLLVAPRIPGIIDCAVQLPSADVYGRGAHDDGAERNCTRTTTSSGHGNSPRSPSGTARL
jgi:hypothetical protein